MGGSIVGRESCLHVVQVFTACTNFSLEALGVLSGYFLVAYVR